MHSTGKYYIVYDDVTVNSSDRIAWTIMHEIGHIILGHLVEFSETALNRGGITSKQYGVLEIEAHYFAAEFLMDRILLKQEIELYNIKKFTIKNILQSAFQRKLPKRNTIVFLTTTISRQANTTQKL